MNFIDLAAQQARIRKQVDSRISTVLQHGQYILGPEVQELERNLAERVGIRHCVGVANGTDALQLALLALGIGPEDEVITPSFSYVAAAEVIGLLGATPVFVDINEVSYNVDVAAVEAAIGDRTKAIVAVDLFGQCADYGRLAEIAARRGVVIVEDAAQSFGATQHGRNAGEFGRISTTSFFPSKPLGCYGDGGACFTDDDRLADLLRSIRAHGQAERYRHVRIGMNARLDTLQAAILLAKLEIFDEEIELRNAAAARYDDLIKKTGLANGQIVPPTIDDDNTSVWAQYTVRVPHRGVVVELMKKEGIPTAVHYPLPLHLQDAFAGSHRQVGSLEHSERVAQEVLSLPMHPYLEESEQQKVIDALARAVRSCT